MEIVKEKVKLDLSPLTPPSPTRGEGAPLFFPPSTGGDAGEGE